LLKTVEYDAYPLSQLLQQKYSDCFQRDPSFGKVSIIFSLLQRLRLVLSTCFLSTKFISMSMILRKGLVR
jgi:hypothetical protein